MVIAAFVATQMLRGPNSREHILALSAAVKDTLFERGVDAESIERLLPELSRDEAKAIALISLHDVDQFAQHILDKSWLLFQTNPAVPLYLSDNPVGLQNLVEGPLR